MKVIAIANHKGGVGKTTTAVNLSAALAELGYDTLLIDMDPQGNATSHLGYVPFSITKTIESALVDDNNQIDVDSLIIERGPRLFLIPANLNMSSSELLLSGMLERERVLKRVIGKIKRRFDYIIVDTPPSLGLFTVNAIYAADEVIVAVQTQPFALEALGVFRRTLAKVYQSKKDYNFKVWGLPTMHDRLTNTSRAMFDKVKEMFGPLTLTPIHQNVRLREASGLGKHILEHDFLSSGTVDYIRLAKEISGEKEEERQENRTHRGD